MINGSRTNGVEWIRVGLMDVRILRISQDFHGFRLEIRENPVKSVKSVHPLTQLNYLRINKLI
jgi:hypothetical protein